MKIRQEDLKKLTQIAMQLGASDAKIILSDQISVEDNLASLCSSSDPQCENYGLSLSCPPHVAGPSAFREWQKESKYSIFVKIDIPLAVMFSDQQYEVKQLLHEIVAGVEKQAVKMGYKNAKAFAGGSCKKIFCNNHADCIVLSKKQQCRNPNSARPSMSGFGINVMKLIKLSEWSAQKAADEDSSNTESMTWVAGLILL